MRLTIYYYNHIVRGVDLALQLVPEQLTLASSTKFFVPQLGNCYMIHIY